MRTCLLVLLLAAACASPGGAATRNFEIAGFERVRVEGPFKVVLTTGVPVSASASGPQSGVDKVGVDLVGRTLVIHNNLSSWGESDETQDSAPVEVRISTHELNGAALMGSGLLQINAVKGLAFDLSVQGSGQVAIGNADVDQLKVALIGTASSVVSGRAGTLTLSTQGVSSFDGSALTAKDATFATNGAATIKAAVSNSATITASGPATVTLTGNPACTTTVHGSASVSGCRPQ